MNIILKNNKGKGRSIISWILNRVLKKKFECDFNLELEELDFVEDDEGMVAIRLKVNARMDKKDLKKLVKEYI